MDGARLRLGDIDDIGLANGGLQVPFFDLLLHMSGDAVVFEPTSSRDLLSNGAGV